MQEGQRSPARPALAAFSAFVMGLALALAAWQWNHIFVDAVAGPLHLLGVPLALVGACVVGFLMAKGLGVQADGHLTLAALMGAAGVVSGVLALWFLPVFLFGGM